MAREFGDISENSEYDDAKNEQGMMERALPRFTAHSGRRDRRVRPEALEPREHRLGRDGDMGGRERVFTIVGGAEADAAAGKISNESPVGAALLGHKKGDAVSTTGPTGREINMGGFSRSSIKRASAGLPAPAERAAAAKRRMHAIFARLRRLAYRSTLRLRNPPNLAHPSSSR